MSKANDLVLQGNEVKLRLQAERFTSGKFIHIDWLRFTVFRRNFIPTGLPLPDFRPQAGTKWEHYLSTVKFNSKQYEWLSGPAKAVVIRSAIEAFEIEHKDPEFQAACSQAHDLARDVATVLGPEFSVNTALKKGQDFYRWRFSIDRAGHECAWVGFLAASDSKDSAAQAASIHVNIHGHACTFAQAGWREKMANLVDMHDANITRVDLALDMFNGLGFDIRELHQHYAEGAFKVRGKNPGCRVDGDWFNNVSRSVYIGCRKSGKETNIYEKGHQLFGLIAQNPWVRAELRYGSQLRILPSDILRNPDDFFAGASDWHRELLARAGTLSSPIPCPQEKKLELQTVLAEVHRNIRWLRSSAAPTIVAAFKFMTSEQLSELMNMTSELRPGRLQKFSESDLHGAYQSVLATFKTVTSANAPRLAMAA